MTFVNFGRWQAGSLLVLLAWFGLPDGARGIHGARPYPPSPPQPPLTGQALYARSCARCHGANGRLGRNGAHDLTKSNLNAFGRTFLVANGMGKMPAFGKQLSAKEIEAVVAYSLTLK